MKKFLLMILLCTGCAAGKFSFTPVYNAQIVQQVQAGMNQTDTLFAKMIVSQDKSYVTYAPDYLQIEAQINSIVLADSLRAKAVKIKFIAINLRTHFLQYEADHKNRSFLSAGEFKAYKNDLHAFWQPLLVAEQSLNQ